VVAIAGDCPALWRIARLPVTRACSRNGLETQRCQRGGTADAGVIVDSRQASRLSWSLFGLAAMLLSCAALLRQVGAISDAAFSVAALELLVPPLAMGWVGALVAARRHDNPIGWLLLAVGVLSAVQAFASEYAIYGLASRPGAVPWPGAFAWISEPVAVSYISVVAAVIALFPTGRALSPRWAVVLWVLVAANLLFVVGSFELWPRRDLMIRINVAEPITLGYVLRVIGTGGVLACAATASLSMVVRFWRSHGDERAQIKWVAYAAAVAFVAVPGAFALNYLFRLPSYAVDLVAWLAVLGLPISVAVAVLKYRLYDIDRIISRTLSYALLTALLAVVYSASVLTLGVLFGDVANRPSWVVAAATLAVAGLFQPARHGIQRAVDRRFNRRRYDAAKMIAAFTGRLRDQLDLDTLDAELLAAIELTMQPTAASLWLQPRGATK